MYKPPSTAKMIRGIIARMETERNTYLRRALNARDEGRDTLASYYTGVADGRNGIAEELTDILKDIEPLWVIPRGYR